MRACLDACVLVPTALRGILMRMAEAGAFDPIWSERIFEEWRHADLRFHPDAENALNVEQALLSARWPNAMVDGGSSLEISLPDPDDVHVVAAAVSGKADFLVTANLRDFPQSAMRKTNVVISHPDLFLLNFYEDLGDAVTEAVKAELELAHAATGESFSQKAFLKRIGLPRLAKRLDAAV